MVPWMFRIMTIVMTGCLVTAAAGPVFAEEKTTSSVDSPVLETPGADVVSIPNLSGNWRGSWFSFSNGHKGPMQASFRQLDASRYEVHFRGRFLKLVPFNYTAVLRVTGYDQDRVYLSGSHRLGPILGTFSYNAWATSTQFVAGYCSQDDRGQFVMSRVCR